ncbi:hypothetical protein FKM82_020250 [Ascaphus truei]
MNWFNAKASGGGCRGNAGQHLYLQDVKAVMGQERDMNLPPLENVLILGNRYTEITSTEFCFYRLLAWAFSYKYKRQIIRKCVMGEHSKSISNIHSRH